ncbi:zinc finger and BTB domain-containing protein 44-like [Pecten maximus]|uniref:zinc finger and BTB domain-containing protein 44-like n=1 Tax=Pecten maximus TaxID=6579 RepID=UPI00145917FD|nr:zinc finger and BTB domain-containing protein 44-like [Pecten maximus]
MSQAPLSMVYRSDKQLPVLFRTLHGFYRLGTFCDVVLVTSHCRIRVHSVIIAAFSPLLYQMLGGESWSIERRQLELTLPNVDYISLLSLIEYCYTGVITVDSSSADKILGVAIALQVKEVEKLCVTFLNAQRSFSSELVLDTRPSALASVSPGRGGNSRESTLVEISSSERFSPNVSTSGQPSSETGSTGHPDTVHLDSDVIAVKTETPDPPVDYDAQLSHQSRGRVVYLEGPESPVADSHRPGMSTVSHSIIDMSKMSPTLLTMHPMLVPTGPPTLQLMSPKGEATLARQISQYREGSQDIVGNASPESDGISVHIQSPSGPVDSEQSQDVPRDDRKQQVTVTCSVCHVLFSSAEALTRHMAVHQSTAMPPTIPQGSVLNSSVESVKQPSPNFYQRGHQPVSGLLSSAVVQGGGGLFKCGTCGKGFKDAQSLKFHRYNHVLRHSCNMCGKRFSRSWNLHRHRKTHFRMPSWPMRTDLRVGEMTGSTSADNLNQSVDLEQSVDLTDGDDDITERDDEGEEEEEDEGRGDHVTDLLSGEMA